MTTTTTDWISFANADLLLSLRAPQGWDAQAVDEFRFTLYRDAADADGYRANMSFVLGEPEEVGVQWFAEFCAAVPNELAGLDGFELIDTDAYRLSSHARVFVVRYRQHAPGAPASSHLQAYVWGNSYRMYAITAATLREHEGRDLPVFDAIVRSLRLLPPRT